VTRQAPDFFTAQLVDGACAYYFRHVFQDWLDVAGVTMTHIVAAMERGYSKLLLFEFVLPPRDVPLCPGLPDLSTRVLLSGLERSEEQWEALHDRAGLKVARFWETVPDGQGLIEAVWTGEVGVWEYIFDNTSYIIVFETQRQPFTSFSTSFLTTL
jgi:hypothetical protein